MTLKRISCRLAVAVVAMVAWPYLAKNIELKATNGLYTEDGHNNEIFK
jgi:hypothetical protein